MARQESAPNNPSHCKPHKPIKPSHRKQPNQATHCNECTQANPCTRSQSSQANHASHANHTTPIKPSQSNRPTRARQAGQCKHTTPTGNPRNSGIRRNRAGEPSNKQEQISDILEPAEAGQPREHAETGRGTQQQPITDLQFRGTGEPKQPWHQAEPGQRTHD